MTDNEILVRAAEITRARALRRGAREVIDSPSTTREVLQRMLAHQPHELFAVLYLDNRHRLIRYVEEFFGTINGASVYPRVVVKRALELNAAAVIAAHNHPSGVAEPSQADRSITNRLRDALALVEVSMLDHFVVGDGETVSFSERGWL